MVQKSQGPCRLTLRWSRQPPALPLAVAVGDLLLPGFAGALSQAAAAQLSVIWSPSCDNMAQDFQFIRLLFPDAGQEQVAVRLLRALAAALGDRADQVRPETKLVDIVAWAEAEGADTVELVTAIEDGAGMEADLLPDDFERMTVREIVEYVCARGQRAV